MNEARVVSSTGSRVRVAKQRAPSGPVPPASAQIPRLTRTTPRSESYSPRNSATLIKVGLLVAYLRALGPLLSRWERDACPIPARHRLQGPRAAGPLLGGCPGI